MPTFALLALLVASPAFAAAPPIGSIEKATGQINRGAVALHPGDAVFEGDRIHAGKDSHALLKIGSDIALHLKADSTIALKREQGVWSPILEQGGAMVHVKPENVSQPSGRPRFYIRTRSATMGVRGTTFYVENRGKDAVYFCPCEGKIDVAAGAGDKEQYVSTHHDHPVMIRAGTDPLRSRTVSAADQPTNHSDSDAAELKAVR
jgi:hypothetical protein